MWSRYKVRKVHQIPIVEEWQSYRPTNRCNRPKTATRFRSAETKRLGASPETKDRFARSVDAFVFKVFASIFLILLKNQTLIIMLDVRGIFDLNLPLRSN